MVIADCIGAHALASICRLLAEDHAGWSGVPSEQQQMLHRQILHDINQHEVAPNRSEMYLCNNDES